MQMRRCADEGMSKYANEWVYKCINMFIYIFAHSHICTSKYLHIKPPYLLLISQHFRQIEVIPVSPADRRSIRQVSYK
jgi:hypothetical protein